jgi:hypothetical protein
MDFHDIQANFVRIIKARKTVELMSMCLAKCKHLKDMLNEDNSEEVSLFYGEGCSSYCRAIS